MKNTHLSEEEIQAIVFDEKVTTANTLHAQQCENCSNRIKAYEIIFAQLKAEPQPTFNFQINNPLVQKPKEFSKTYLLVFSSIAFGLTAYLSKFSLATNLIIITAAILFIGLLIDLFNRNEKKLRILNDQMVQH